MERALRMLMAFTYLPGFVPLVFRGMPTVWRGRHRLIFCWLIFMQAVHPGRKTLEEMARWTPATITAGCSRCYLKPLIKLYLYYQ